MRSLSLSRWSLLAAMHLSLLILLDGSSCWATRTANDTTLVPFIFGGFVQTATFSVASQLGFFTAQGLNVTFSQIPNSTFGIANLLAGGYDIASVTADNIYNVRFNEKQNVSLIGQLDLGASLAIAAIPGIDSILDFKGKSFLVDSPASGYSFALRKILSLFGLTFGTDYTFQTVGGTPIRFADLMAGSLPNGSATFGTVLTYPFVVEAVNLPTPFPILANVSDFINPLLDEAFVATTAAIDSATAASSTNTPSPLVRAMAALLSANAYLAANAACSISAISAALNLTLELAQEEYAIVTDPATGETSSRNFEVSRQGLLNGIDIRAQVPGGFAGAGSDFDFADAIIPGPGKLVDYRVRDAALGLVTSGPAVCPFA